MKKYFFSSVFSYIIKILRRMYQCLTSFKLNSSTEARHNPVLYKHSDPDNFPLDKPLQPTDSKLTEESSMFVIMVQAKHRGMFFFTINCLFFWL